MNIQILKQNSIPCSICSSVSTLHNTNVSDRHGQTTDLSSTCQLCPSFWRCSHWHDCDLTRPVPRTSSHFSLPMHKDTPFTETTLLDVLDSIYSAAEGKQVTVLIGLDLCAVFDMVCHDSRDITAAPVGGVQCAGTALTWIQSYLG